jgi:hypothetical protein
MALPAPAGGAIDSLCQSRGLPPQGLMSGRTGGFPRPAARFDYSFVDGNKRTAEAAMPVFLELNDFVFVADRDAPVLTSISNPSRARACPPRRWAWTGTGHRAG